MELRRQIFNFNNVQQYSKYAKYSTIVHPADNGMDNNISAFTEIDYWSVIEQRSRINLVDPRLITLSQKMEDQRINELIITQAFLHSKVTVTEITTPTGCCSGQ